jgi:hypothetical protein
VIVALTALAGIAGSQHAKATVAAAGHSQVARMPGPVCSTNPAGDLVSCPRLGRAGKPAVRGEGPGGCRAAGQGSCGDGGCQDVDEWRR